MDPRARKFFGAALRIVLSGAALAFVFRQLNLRQLTETLRAIDPGWFLLALGAYTASKIVSAFRLATYLRTSGIPLTTFENLRLYFIGMFYNLFLPGGIGGDAYKVWLLRRDRQVPAGKSIQAILVDRVSGLAALTALAFFFAWYSFSGMPYAGWLLVAGLASLPAMFLVHAALGKHFLPITVSTTATAMVVQMLQAGSAWALLHGLHVSDALAPYLTVFLLSSLVAVLPISIGGIGLRELVFVTASNYTSVSAETSVAFSLLFFVITAVSSLPGGFISSRS